VSYAYQEYQVGYGRRHGGSCLLTNKKGAVNVEFKVPAKNGQIEIDGYEMYVMFPLPMTGMECGWAVSHGATTAATIQEAVQKFYPFMIEYICDKEDSDNYTQQYILKNLNSLGNSVDFWGRKNDRQHVIDGMSTTQKSQLLCYILRNHEAFGKMTCRDWKNWLLDDAEPQFGIWF
jgi:hypothetical protein